MVVFSQETLHSLAKCCAFPQEGFKFFFFKKSFASKCKLSQWKAKLLQGNAKALKCWCFFLPCHILSSITIPANKCRFSERSGNVSFWFQESS